MQEICSKLTKKTTEQSRSDVFSVRSVVLLVNFKHISHFFLVFLLIL